jgi:tripartite-type tricarboxylate transporter receptor subunit TctC
MAVGAARPAIRHREPTRSCQQYRHRDGRERAPRRFLVATFVNAVNASLYNKLNFNFIRDIAPVASIAREPFAIEVHPSVPGKTVPEFITHAKANPGRINMASAGVGSGNHIAGELFKMMTGVNLVHVPYRGAGPALVDLLGGQVQVMFAGMSLSIEYVRAGKLRALAVTIATRSPVLPDLPTVAEFAPGYEFSFWTGIGAPRTTPAEIVDKLNMEINGFAGSIRFDARELHHYAGPSPAQGHAGAARSFSIASKRLPAAPTTSRKWAHSTTCSSRSERQTCAPQLDEYMPAGMEAGILFAT